MFRCVLIGCTKVLLCCDVDLLIGCKSSQVNTLPIAKSQTLSKQNKGMHKCSSVCSERGVPLPVLHRAENESVSGHAKMPPASHQVSATSLKLLIQQIHPHVRVKRDSGML